MREIKRCPACLTYVYSDARRCHGCGERIGRARFLTRGSWIFIVLAVTGYAIGRGIDLQQDKRDRVRREIEEASRVDLVRNFLKGWLAGDARLVRESTSDREDFAPALDRLRNKYPGALPATTVGPATIEVHHEFLQHFQVDDGEVSHRPEEWSAKLRASANTSHASGFRSFRTRPQQHWWHLDTYDFRVKYVKDDATYWIDGNVCLEDHLVCCLSIHQIKGPDGKVEPKD